MTGVLSQCTICGQFLDSRKDLREHKDKNHRITNAKMMIKSVVVNDDDNNNNNNNNNDDDDDLDKLWSTDQAWLRC